MTTTIDVDFNDVEQNGQMVVLTKYADGPVQVGARVILREGDENIVQGRVVSIVNDLATLEVDWGSWNRVNTLPDALDDAIEAVKQAVDSFDHLFERRPTGFDPDDLPEQKVEITT